MRDLTPDLCDEDMYARTYLFSHLIGAVIRLAAVSDKELARRMLDQWKRVIRASLFTTTVPAAA